MKRYAVHFEGDRDTSASKGEGCILPDFDQFYGQANSLSTCKRYIKEIRADYQGKKPHNFRVYDMMLEHPYRTPIYTEE